MSHEDDKNAEHATPQYGLETTIGKKHSITSHNVKSDIGEGA